jgi:hypothetical protein
LEALWHLRAAGEGKLQGAQGRHDEGRRPVCERCMNHQARDNQGTPPTNAITCNRAANSARPLTCRQEKLAEGPVQCEPRGENFLDPSVLSRRSRAKLNFPSRTSAAAQARVNEIRVYGLPVSRRAADFDNRLPGEDSLHVPLARARTSSCGRS